ILNDLQVCGVSIQQMTRKTLDDKARGANHQGIIARVKPAKQLNENDIDDILAQHESPLLLVLDGVTDPHNLGACLRNADAAGAAA
ncbi:23S rRNA (guanosine(2251)-2'-O)-methyltransferase RlmB, partial [Vibrio parahaemolyticus]|nr:23S rRNA (guanosine(2251)-2'-O)-methyltransferase RlmB [Vibrio parahaemolyticus]